MLYAVGLVQLLQRNWENARPVSGEVGQFGPGATDIPLLLLYAALLYLTARVMIATENKRNKRENIALKYHLVAVTAVAISALAAWLLLPYFGWRYVVWMNGLAWLSYGLHWLIARHNPKGIRKQEAFL